MPEKLLIDYTDTLIDYSKDGFLSVQVLTNRASKILILIH